MKAKETKKSQQTKQLIYNTAIALFTEKGFDQTTMREIAKQANISLGLAYYHFRTKDDLVMKFYEATQKESLQACKEFFQQESKLQSKIQFILKQKVKQFYPYRNFLHVLANHASNPSHPLSPFSQETQQIRDDAIHIFSLALQHSKDTLPKDLRTILPELLWLYQLGIIYFWLVDGSEEKRKTDALIDESLKLLFSLLKLANLPLMGKARKLIVSIYSEIKEV
ncbi:MAG: TetR/AcrR family transcriptional regulator [Spirochaetota bacterium]